MRVGSGRYTYEWLDNWAQFPDSENARGGWAHPGVAVSGADEIITFHQGDPTVLMFHPDGHLIRSFDTGLTEGHGITLTNEGGTEYLWIADTGTKRIRKIDYMYQKGGAG